MEKNNNAVWIIVLISILAFFLFIMPFSGGRWGGFCGMMGNYYGSNYGWGMMNGFGSIFMPLVFIAIILVIVWLVKQLQPQGRKRK